MMLSVGAVQHDLVERAGILVQVIVRNMDVVGRVENAGAAKLNHKAKPARRSFIEEGLRRVHGDANLARVNSAGHQRDFHHQNWDKTALKRGGKYVCRVPAAHPQNW